MMRIMRVLAVVWLAVCGIMHVEAQAMNRGAEAIRAFLDDLREHSYYTFTEERIAVIERCIWDKLDIPGRGIWILNERFDFKGCLDEDERTGYFPPDEYRISYHPEEYGYLGISFKLHHRPAGIVITKIWDDGPAHQSGLLKVGDVITAVVVREKHRALDGLKLADVASLIGDEKPGSLVQLIVWRNGHYLPNPVKIIRGNIPFVSSKVINGNVGYLKIESFRKETLVEDEVLPVLEDFRARGIRRLILDLADNPGGRLRVALKMARLFARDVRFPLLIARHREAGVSDEYLVNAIGPFATWQIAVIVNHDTASSGEIVAGAMQIWGIPVFSEDARTYGKGSVQLHKTFENGGVFYFTIQRFYLADGQCPEGVGIVPNTVIADQKRLVAFASRMLKEDVYPVRLFDR